MTNGIQAYKGAEDSWRKAGSLGSTLLLTLLISLPGGCASEEPEAEVCGAALAGDRIFVEVHKYTYFQATLSHMAELRNSRYYLLLFPIPSNGDTVIKASGLMLLPGPNISEASFSDERIVFGTWPQQGFHNGEWSVGVLEWGRGKMPQVLRLWKKKIGETKLPPFAVSNDGRYLAILDGTDDLLDMKNFERHIDPTVSRMFGTVRGFGPKPEQVLRLTQNLNYLVFKPDPMSTNGSTRFTATGGTYSRRWYSAAVERESGQVEAFPDKLNFDAVSASPIFYQDAAESKVGDLLLLYAQRDPQSGGELYTIRDKRLSIQHQILIGPAAAEDIAAGGPGRSWDPVRHRMLFYKTASLGRGRQPREFKVWDYESGSLRTVALDLAQAFREAGTEYVPINER